MERIRIDEKYIRNNFNIEKEAINILEPSQIGTLDIEDIFDGKNIENAIENLKDLSKNYNKEIFFQVNSWGYDGGIEVAINENVYRMETEKETISRLIKQEKEKRSNELKLNRAKKEVERLEEKLKKAKEIIQNNESTEKKNSYDLKGHDLTIL